MFSPPVVFLRITLCLVIFGASGTSSASVATKPTPIFGYMISIRITNVIFNDTLKDQNSEDYKSLRNEVTQLINNVFNCSNCDPKNTYGGIVEMTFGKGSVIANSTLMFRIVQVNATVIKYLFASGVEDSPHPHLQLDMDYTMVIPVAVPLPEEPTGTTPLATTKTPAQIKNSGTTHGTLETEHPKVHTTTAAAAGGSGGVPGWVIAILVLAALSLLLLIIILILLLTRWCCRKKQSGSKNVSSDPSPYEEPNPKAGLPAYSPPEDSKDPKNTLYGSIEKPQKNRTGMYVVNH